MPEPGEPHNPMQGMRTKPEASDFAMKNKVTSDWFRHDGKNAEAPRAGILRLLTKQAQDIAQKDKSENEWFDHQANGAANGSKKIAAPKPKQRCRTPISQENFDRMMPSGTPSWADYKKPIKDVPVTRLSAEYWNNR